MIAHEKQDMFTLFQMFQELKKVADGASVDTNEIIRQYHALRDKMVSIAPGSKKLVPEIKSENLEQAKMCINLALAYLGPSVMPIFFDWIGTLKEQGLIRPEDSLAKLFPILTDLKLSPNWALAASALCLIEVLVNRKLEDLGAETKGDFDERIRRLSSIIKAQKAVKIPDLLPSAFYKVRNKVVHEGKEPSPEELEQILQFLISFNQKLRST